MIPNPKILVPVVIAAAVLASILVAYFYIRSAEQAKIENRFLEEEKRLMQQEQQIEDTIKDEIDNSPHTVDDVLDFLRNR